MWYPIFTFTTRKRLITIWGFELTPRTKLWSKFCWVGPGGYDPNGEVGPLATYKTADRAKRAAQQYYRPRPQSEQERGRD